MNNKNLALVLILILAISSLTLTFANIPFGKAQSGTTVSSTMIKEDTTWTKANSPYNLTGNVLITSGTTVTVETGTTLNLNGYYIMVNGSLLVQQDVTINMQDAAYIQVNGVLSAIGASTNPIQINGYSKSSHIQAIYYSSIIFSQVSTGWNQQTSSGSIIEKAILNSISVGVSSSVKLANNTMLGAALGISGGSPLITDNVLGNGISVNGGSPIISNNTIHFTVTFGASGNSQGIENNQTALFECNVISGGPAHYPGITLSGNALSYNLIIKRNFISTGSYPGNNGIEIAIATYYQVSIINNTIINNDIGIHVVAGIPRLISGNNIYNNKLNVKLAESNPIDCANNWWGTTDIQAINQTIYDLKNDFNLGTVSFIPFLTAPNPQAPTAPTSKPEPSTSPSASQTPSSSPTVPEFPTLVILPFFVSLILVAVYFKNRRTIYE